MRVENDSPWEGYTVAAYKNRRRKILRYRILHYRLHFYKNPQRVSGSNPGLLLFSYIFLHYVQNGRQTRAPKRPARRGSQLVLKDLVKFLF